MLSTDYTCIMQTNEIVYYADIQSRVFKVASMTHLCTEIQYTELHT